VPCWTQTNVSAVWEGVDINVLKEALERMGHTVTMSADGKSLTWSGGSYRNGVITARNDLEVEVIKREYGSQTIRQSAKKFGWKVRQVDRWVYEVVK
jgi:hypothetical protein